MTSIQIIVLALVQGLTEFLPISSSAHLVLVPILTGWPDQGLAFDVAIHVGTLLAVIVYFRVLLGQMLTAWVKSLTTGQHTMESRLAWAVIWGSIPVLAIGFLLAGFIEGNLRSPLVIAIATIIFGLLLWWSDIAGRRERESESIIWKDALVIGLAQVLALVPGVSRSGVTMMAGLGVGLTRQAAAQFSFLLSIPVILIAGGYETYGLIQHPGTIEWSVLFTAIAISGISAYLCIRVFLNLLDRISFLPFVIYRLILGALLLWLFI